MRSSACPKPPRNRRTANSPPQTFFEEVVPNTTTTAAGVTKLNTPDVVVAARTTEGRDGQTGSTLTRRTPAQPGDLKIPGKSSTDYKHIFPHIYHNKKLCYQPYEVTNNRKPVKDRYKKHGTKNCQQPLANSGKTKHVCKQLEIDYQRSMGAQLCPRVYTRINAIPTTKPSCKGASIPTERTTCPVRGGTGNVEETGYNSSSKGTSLQGLPVPTVLRTQKRRRHKTSDQPEHICGSTPLQNGGDPLVERRTQRVRLDDEGRSEGCLLHDSNKPHPPTPPKIQVGGSDLPIQMSPVRAIVGSLGLYQDHQANSSNTQRPRPENDNLYRRYPSDGRVQETAKAHTAGLIYLLQNLTFIINEPKSINTPTQVIDFLGFTVNSKSMELKLPGEKVKKIRHEAQKLQETRAPTALQLSRFLGKLNHASQAINPAPLFYRNLQCCHHSALWKGNQDYSQPVEFTTKAREELVWWQQHLLKWNGKCLLRHKPNLVIETDASTIGWGATCQGVQTGGRWSKTEARLHINCLELLAASLAIKCFAKQTQNIVIHLKMDNTTALTYINKFGGTVSPELNKLTKELLTWCLERNIILQATHLAGILNVTADTESRVMRDRSDWMLHPHIQIHQQSNRTTSSGLVCVKTHTPTPRLCELETRSECNSNGCLLTRLDKAPSLCKSTMEPDREGPIYDGATESTISADSSSVEITSMVHNTLSNVSTDPTPTSPNPEPDPSDTQCQSTRNNAASGRLGYLRDRFRTQNLSEETSELLLASWRQKSSNTYDPYSRSGSADVTNGTQIPFQEI